jgi:hypothetical protein
VQVGRTRDGRRLAGDLGAVAPEKKGEEGRGADARGRPGRERKGERRERARGSGWEGNGPARPTRGKERERSAGPRVGLGQEEKEREPVKERRGGSCWSGLAALFLLFSFSFPRSNYSNNSI